MSDDLIREMFDRWRADMMRQWENHAEAIAHMRLAHDNEMRAALKVIEDHRSTPSFEVVIRVNKIDSAILEALVAAIATKLAGSTKEEPVGPACHVDPLASKPWWYVAESHYALNTQSGEELYSSVIVLLSMAFDAEEDTLITASRLVDFAHHYGLTDRLSELLPMASGLRARLEATPGLSKPFIERLLAVLAEAGIQFT